MIILVLVSCTSFVYMVHLQSCELCMWLYFLMLLNNDLNVKVLIVFRWEV